VHGAGRERGAGPLVSPVAQTSTFTFESAAQLRRYVEGDDELFLYSRDGNPTVRELEEAIAALERAESALATASGMAAMSAALFSLVKAGDEVLGSASLYGGTLRLLTQVLPRFGVRSRLLPVAELAQAGADGRARALVVESPTNPTLEIVDLALVCANARERGIVTIVDNTFATPHLQRPLELGADLVMHSLTKSLSGHSDLIAGALAGSSERIAAARAAMKELGGCLDPHAAFLALRGLRTLHLRVERQCANAMALARRLDGHPAVRRVLYPGLPSFPGHDVAARQMAAFGGMLTIDLAGGQAAAERFYDRLQLVARAASLGGVESLASLPVLTSHFGLPEEKVRAAGVSPGMVRLSMGVEDADDLAADVEQALAG
jgi:cystathionine beta-lyase/cystathionine gamma-synthase